MTCPECRTELEPVMTICPGCGARLGAAKRGEPEWREQVRETVARHKQKRRLQQERLEDDARQLSIFPDASPDDDEDRKVRERRAEIRARVEERLHRRRGTPPRGGFFDAGEVSIPSAGRSSAARKLVREPEAYDPVTKELDPVPPLDEDELDERGLDAPYDAGGAPLDVDVPMEGELFVELGLASAGERVLAGLIDVAFVALIQLTLFYLTTHLVSQRLDALPTSAVVAMGVVGAVLAAGYFLFFWGLSGQTLGKLLTGSRVVDHKGGALGFGRAGVRLLGTIVAVLPLFAGFLGLWTDPGRRGWHDRIAGTKVVRG